MPRFRLLIAISFVASSIVTAYFYQSWMRRHEDGQTSFSSQEDLVGQVRSIIEKSQDAQRRLSEMGLSGAQDAYHCQCTLAGLDHANYQFENWRECGEARSYFRDEIEKLPPIFRDIRSRAPAEFPRICMTYMMRRQFPKADQEIKSYFAKCADPTGTPERGNYKACVTESYVNSVYNIFGDVTDCFGIPQKDLLPKVLTESGFHLNALGAGFDAGISQMTGPALEHANLHFKKMQKQARTSEVESCQRISSYLDRLAPFQVSKEIGISNRCGLITPPENPLLNLFYLAIKYKQDLSAVGYYQEKYGIKKLMERAGVSGFQQENLNQILISLSFNAGAHSAVLYLKNFLEGRIHLRELKRGGAVALDDFDFSVDVSSFKDQSAERAELGKMSFPAYLMVYQNSGAKGYLSGVMKYAKVLNTAFKEGTCVPDAYLSLSP